MVIRISEVGYRSDKSFRLTAHVKEMVGYPSQSAVR